ncbi:hypothetical protein HPP92_008610 [Vanilla planifolia]|uniref:Uncharacterized protein n=1 Tax=Vanilla planifolia TaxID=51239 RepID=A0A835R6N9_VANPL|nr:hypothetical protein HPP92_008798 [Vanilla planifolia]KAG0486515.1 hypothetical protein HPP92_008610 [Vanilla planifolia]
MASQGDQFPPIIIDIPLTEAGETQSPLHSFSMKVPLSPAPQSSEQPMKMKLNHEVHESATHEHILCSQRAKESCYDSFRTRSANFDRQLSHLKNIDSHVVEIEPIPTAERYFDALEGPELENLKKSEKLILPEDEEWPFLLRFPISSFGMPLGVGIQALLWKTMRMSSSTSFLHVNPAVNFVLCHRMLKRLVVYLQAVQVNFFRGFRFSLVWWAYTVPMTSVATATIDYTTEVTNPFTKFLSVALSFISALAVAALLITTILHALVFHNLFPNDIAIAISVKRTSSRKKHSHRRAESTNRKMNSIVAPED